MVKAKVENRADIINAKLDKYGMDFYTFCEENLMIKKDAPGSPLIPFILNDDQIKLANIIFDCLATGKPARVIVLKARRVGISTLVAGIYFWFTGVSDIGENTNAYILSNDDEGVAYLFRMHKTFYDELDPDLKPLKRIDNKKELAFENPDDATRGSCPGRRSRVNVASAAKGDIGSGSSTDLFHGSEIAKWDNPEDALTAMLQAVPRSGIVVYESTARGRGGYFYDEWGRAEDPAGDSDFIPMFVPWFNRKENFLAEAEIVTHFEKEGLADYAAFAKSMKKEEKDVLEQFNLNLGQMAWRRWCIKNQCRGKLSIFHQEHPATSEEAFIASGECYFSEESLEDYANNKPVPKWVGDIRIEPDDKGGEVAIFVENAERPRLEIYEFPRVGDEYVMGVDVAEGAEVTNDKTDNSSVHVLDKEYREMAHWCGKEKPEKFEKYVTAIGTYYRYAYAMVEANLHGRHVLVNMSTISKYPIDKIHKRMKYDEESKSDTEKLGWYTSGAKGGGGTRGMMIDNLEGRITDRDFPYLDPRTVKECRDFVEKGGKLQANSGCRDDRVFSLGIAAYGVKYISVQVSKEYKIPESMNEFNRGSVKI